MTDITIRRAETPADYRACQDAQRRAWGLADDSYVVPVATMVGASTTAASSSARSSPTARRSALSFAFLGRTEGRLCLYSQLTGRRPRLPGPGTRLPSEDRPARLRPRRGTSRASPGRSTRSRPGNARFNLDKLGATAGRYVENMYGPRTDALNRGAPTDRLIAVWETTPAPPSEPPPVESLPRAILTRTAEFRRTPGRRPPVPSSGSPRRHQGPAFRFSRPGRALGPGRPAGVPRRLRRRLSRRRFRPRGPPGVLSPRTR